MDSPTLPYDMNRDHEVFAISFDYGQKHSKEFLAELKKIDAQEAIDSAETAVEQDADFFRHLVEADEKIAEVDKSSLDACLVRRLGFDYQPLEP